MRKQVVLIFLLILTLPLSSQTRIDCAVEWGDSPKVFFFTGTSYYRYNVTQTKVDRGYPRAVDNTTWKGVSFPTIDAALDWGNGKMYFFSGTRYIRFDKYFVEADNGYPKDINNRTWPGLSFPTIDAAVNGGNGKAYFFSGKRYIKYDIRNDRADPGYPQPISSYWKGIPFTQIDAAVRDKNVIHLFSGNQYMSFNISTGNAIQTSPAPLSDWEGLPSDIQPVPPEPINPSPIEIDSTDVIETPEDNVNSNIMNTDITVDTYEVQVNFPVRYENTVLGKSQICALEDGTYVLGYQNKDTVYFLKLDNSFKMTGQPLQYEGYWLSHIIPASDGGFYFALGKDVNNTYINGYPNALFAGKISTSGRQEYLSHIFGGTGHGPGKSWFDGRSEARLTLGNNGELGIYYEVQKNWADLGQDEDIHNGDAFNVLDASGRLLDSINYFWTASHSSTIQTAFGTDGNYYTMTIGDAYPFGLQFYNRTLDENWILWPPDEDYVPYEEVKSTNAAGILENMIPVKDGFLALIGTLEHPNIGVFDKVDIMLLKTDFQGNVAYKKWLTRTPDSDESVLSIIPWGSNFLVASGKGNDYDDNWKPGPLTVIMVDENGNKVSTKDFDSVPFGTYSRMVKGHDNSAVYTYCENGSNTISIFQIRSN